MTKGKIVKIRIAIATKSFSKGLARYIYIQRIKNNKIAKGTTRLWWRLKEFSWDIRCMLKQNNIYPYRYTLRGTVLGELKAVHPNPNAMDRLPQSGFDPDCEQKVANNAKS